MHGEFNNICGSGWENMEWENMCNLPIVINNSYPSIYDTNLLYGYRRIVLFCFKHIYSLTEYHKSTVNHLNKTVEGSTCLISKTSLIKKKKLIFCQTYPNLC